MNDTGPESSMAQVRATPWRLIIRVFCLRLCYAGLWCLTPLTMLVDGEPVQAQFSGALPIFGLQFSPDGKFLAAAANSTNPPGPVVIWDVRDWTVHQVHRPGTGSLDLDFSPDSTQLAYGTKAGVVGILDVPSGKLLREINAHSNAVFSVAYSPDGKSLASASADRSIKMWNVSTGELIHRFDGHSDTVDSIAVSPDGTTLLSGGNDQKANLWDIPSGKIKKSFKANDLIVRRVAFSRDGKYFLVSSWDGKVRIRETATGQLRALLSSGSDCADLTGDNHLVATSGQGSTAEVFAVDLHAATADEKQQIAQTIEKFQDDSYEVRELAAKNIVGIGMIAEPQLREAMSHEDAETRVQARHLLEKVLSPEPIARLAGHRGDVEVVCFSPDGQLLATACRGGDIKVWDGTSFAELKTLDFPATNKQKAKK